MTSRTDNRFAHIDAMRALAVMLVVVAHAGWGNIVPGGSGVTIFFSISGFIITYLLLRERDRTGGFKMGGFYLRRAVKIGPPLLVCVIIPTVILGVIKTINWAPVVGILFFYYNWFKAAGYPDAPLPGSGVVWSLSIEEQFYLGFAIIWVLTIRSRVRLRWLAAAAGLAAVVSLGLRILLASGPEDRIYYGSDTRLDGIALGIVTAIAFHYSLRQSGAVQKVVHWCMRDSVFFAAVLLYLLSLVIRDDWFRNTLRYTFQSVAACLVILYGFGTYESRTRAVFNTLARLRLVRFIGLSSYSIYLIHITAMYYVYDLTEGLSDQVRTAVLAVAGTVSGMLIYLAVERPVQRLRRTNPALRRACDPGIERATATVEPATAK
ncbi:acyltransferase [Skermania sp. ID1734]|uniref:acyltransferase family protein n=1 Tax=Skermania sp. ID1734 TaxID=2597516 RepID=UPI00117F3AAA|nr:acyltransferase [Skermania sp. ID1734]TSD94464.1 acyltransferase [Skermania sp. ID1734]